MNIGIYNLVKIKKEDYDLIYELKKNVYIKYVEEIWGWDEDIQKDLFKKFIENCKDTAYLIKLKDEVIGFYNYEILENGDYEIGNIFIVPKYQGKGIGTEILTGILELNKDSIIIK